MDHVIKVPDVGEGIAEVELTDWHVQPGDIVSEDQALADVMTDKASVEIPSPVAGRVVALGGKVGQMLAVGSELIRIDTTDAAPAPASADSRPSPVVLEPPAVKPSASPAPTAVQVAAAPATVPAERPIASPAVRRRAWELGIDLLGVQPGGTAGRILMSDLERHAQTHASTATSTTGRGTVEQPAAAPATYPPPPRVAGSDATQDIPVIGLRRRIAMHMQESKRRIPHFSYVEECDVTELEALRHTLNQRWGATRGKLTLLPLLMRAMVLALREHPQLNARFDDDNGVVTRHTAVHLGVAAQTEHGLMVPVVRHAETRDIWAMGAEVARLAEAARTGRATRAELSGSTITLSSLGALGGIVSTPVINRPEVAIVAVNRIVERPVLRGGAVVARQMMNLSSSFDHRVVDGMDAARFIQAVRALLESPALLFVE